MPSKRPASRKHKSAFRDAGLPTLMTFDEIASRFGITNTRVQQICYRAIEKLREGLTPIAREYFDDESIGEDDD